MAAWRRSRALFCCLRSAAVCRSLLSFRPSERKRLRLAAQKRPTRRNLRRTHGARSGRSTRRSRNFKEPSSFRHSLSLFARLNCDFDCVECRFEGASRRRTQSRRNTLDRHFYSRSERGELLHLFVSAQSRSAFRNRTCFRGPSFCCALPLLTLVLVVHKWAGHEKRSLHP